MKQALKISFLLAIFAFQLKIVLAQNISTDNNKIVKWESIVGENNEYIIFMPAGYITVDQRDYKVGKGYAGTNVEKQLTISRYINGVVLLVEYYEGDAKQIQEELQKREKLISEKEVEINGFKITYFSETSKNRFSKIQHFLNKNKLYVVKAIANTSNNRIVKAFLESVRLVNQNNVAAPNAPTADTTPLPQIVEKEPIRLDDSKAIPSEEADRKLIILKATAPIFTPKERRGLGAGRLKLKVLFSSSGKVSSVEILESPWKLLEKTAIEAAKNTVFIPGEKDGKLVSVYKIIEYSFEMGRF